MQLKQDVISNNTVPSLKTKRLIGIALTSFCSFGFLFFANGAVSVFDRNPIFAQLMPAVVAIVVMCGYSIFHFKFNGITRPTYCIVASCMVIGASVVLALPIQQTWTLHCLRLLLSMTSYMLFTFVLFSLLSSYDFRWAVRICVLSLLACSCFMLLIYALPSEILMLASAISMAVTTTVIAFDGESRERHCEDSIKIYFSAYKRELVKLIRASISTLLIMFVAISTFFFASHSGIGFTISSSFAFGGVILAVFIMLYLYVILEKWSFLKLHRTVIPIVGFALWIIFFFDNFIYLSVLVCVTSAGVIFSLGTYFFVLLKDSYTLNAEMQLPFGLFVSLLIVVSIASETFGTIMSEAAYSGSSSMTSFVLFLAFLSIFLDLVFSFFGRTWHSKSAQNAYKEGITVNVLEMEKEQIDRIATQYNLTGREQDVVYWLARGYSYNYISESMSVSIDTVRTHTKNVYRKLNIHNRNELIELLKLPEHTSNVSATT